MKKKLITTSIVIIVSILLLFTVYKIKISRNTDKCTFIDQDGKTKTVEYVKFDGCNTNFCTEYGISSTQKACAKLKNGKWESFP